MSAPSLHILCAKLGLEAYKAGFLSIPLETVDVVQYDRVFDRLIWGNDGLGVGKIPFGFISRGEEGEIVTIRGTQTPDGSLVEWLDDLNAFLVQCPFAVGRWHAGFGSVYSTLVVTADTGENQPLGQYLKARLAAGVDITVSGHSLGGPLASYAALEALCPRAPVLFASPKWGDTLLTQTAHTLWSDIPFPSYANPNDAVPKVPITVDHPWRIEDFQPIAPSILLPASLVSPPVPAGWTDSHNLANYLRLLQAML